MSGIDWREVAERCARTVCAQKRWTDRAVLKGRCAEALDEAIRWAVSPDAEARRVEAVRLGEPVIDAVIAELFGAAPIVDWKAEGERIAREVCEKFPKHSAGDLVRQARDEVWRQVAEGDAANDDSPRMVALRAAREAILAFTQPRDEAIAKVGHLAALRVSHLREHPLELTVEIARSERDRAHDLAAEGLADEAREARINLAHMILRAVAWGHEDARNLANAALGV